MGYFSNGTEGMMYEEAFCNRCLHQGGGEKGPWCTVWLLHELYNSDECNKPESFLHVLIPRSKDGLSNEQCTMFLEDPHWNQETLPF